LLSKGSNVVIVDYLLATGGTMAAAAALVEKAGSKAVAGLCIVELEGLNGRGKLNMPFESLLLRPA
jgi:adenine phosphoribosyltransferase